MSTSKQNILSKLHDKNKKPTAAEMFALGMKKEEIKDEIKSEEVKNETETETETKAEVHAEDTATETTAAKQSTFIDLFKEKEKKKTIEDTHTRSTFLVKNELLARMDKLAKKRKRGFKTDLVNHAIEQLLDDIEDK